MNAWRWMIPMAATALLSLWGCEREGYEEGSDTIVIEDREPDITIDQDDDPDIVVEEDDGFEADIDIDDGKVEGEVKVED